MSEHSTTPSSLISINTASEQELQRLPGIGPVLARRIVEQRQSSGPIEGPEQLLAIRGFKQAQLRRLAPLVDWDRPPPAPQSRLPSHWQAWLVALFGALVGLVAIQPIVLLQLEEFADWQHDPVHYATSLLNLLALTFTLSSLALACAWLCGLLEPDLAPRLRRPVRGAMVVIGGSLAGLLIATASTHWLLRARIDAPLHLVNLTILAGGLLLLLWLLYAPQLCCLLKRNPGARLVGAYDLSLVALIAAVVALRLAAGTPMVDLLLCWAGLLFAHHGLLLLRGRSVFIELALELPQWPDILERYPGIAGELLELQRRALPEAGRSRLYAAAGGLLVVAGSLICAFSAWQLFAYLTRP